MIVRLFCSDYDWVVYLWPVDSVEIAWWCHRMFCLLLLFFPYFADSLYCSKWISCFRKNFDLSKLTSAQSHTNEILVGEAAWCRSLIHRKIREYPIFFLIFVLRTLLPEWRWTRKGTTQWATQNDNRWPKFMLLLSDVDISTRGDTAINPIELNWIYEMNRAILILALATVCITAVSMFE